MACGEELQVHGRFTRWASFEEGSGKEASPGPLFPSYTNYAPSFFLLLSLHVVR